MLCDSKDRITGDKLEVHPFFRNLNWSLLRTFKPPFVPTLVSMTDTSYFASEDLTTPLSLPPNSNVGEDTLDLYRNPNNRDLAFVGYTYKRWETLNMD